MHLVERLAGQFRQRARLATPPTQLLITTHSPYFVDALTPKQVWVVAKGDNGHTKAKRAIDIPSVREMTEQGIPLGSLWYSNHLGDSALT